MSSRVQKPPSAKSAARLVRAIERANSASLGAEEAASRVRRYAAAHETPHDDRHAFAKLCEAVFAQGLGFQVIAKHWPALEEAFAGFDPAAVAAMGDGDVGRLLATPIVRNKPKVVACIENARRWVELAVNGSYLARVAGLAGADSATEGWPDLASALQRDFRRLREPAARTVLKRWGFFTARAHPGAQRVLERLGLLVSQTPEPRVQAKIAQVSQVMGMDPYAIEASLAIFAGTGPCQKKPRCELCPLNEECAYARSIGRE